MKSGYDTALSLAYEKLGRLTPEAVCGRSGARYEDGEYLIPWFNRAQPLSRAPTANKIIWLHYLTAQGVKAPSGKLISYREAGGLFYEPNFIKRAVDPFVKRFGDDPGGLIKAGEAFGGFKTNNGDASVTINVLPYMPITFIIWVGGEEFGPGGGILFDSTAKTWLCAEDLAVLASLSVHELINYN